VRNFIRRVDASVRRRFGSGTARASTRYRPHLNLLERRLVLSAAVPAVTYILVASDVQGSPQFKHFT
jgi:hypothetical protein